VIAHDQGEAHDPNPRGPCGKRCYSSARRAKEAHRRFGWRIRAYRCETCRAWHAANHEKGDAARERRRNRRGESA
jgi:hypothetical protein